MATLVTKNSSTAAAVPGTGDLVQGELAINVTDKRLFTKNAGGSVVEVGTNPSSLVVTGDVGIGTSSPGAKLDVVSGTGSLARFTRGSIAVSAFIGASEAFWGTDTNHPLVFTTNGTEKMRLDSSGNLGLGVTPDAWQSGYRSYTMQYGGSLATTTGIVQLGQNYFYNASSQYIYRTPDFASFYRQQSGQHMWFTAPSGTAGNAITFTQAMTLDASGNLLVGTTTLAGAGGFSFQSQGGTGFAAINNNNAGATGYVFQSFRRSSVEIGSITQNGTTAVLFNTTSDRRLKDNIVPAPSASDVIDAIEIVSHDWKSAPDEHVTYGVIAQDLALVAPQAVLQGDDGDEIEKTWGVDYSKLVPMLIKEIQSLRARVAALETA